MGSKHTTIAGIATLGIAVLNGVVDYLNGHPVNYEAIMMGITTLYGLLMARDHAISDRSAGAR